MNALKTILAVAINLIAFFYFVARGLVVWPVAILMTVGSIIGGYWGARFAKRIDQRVLRVFVVVTGLVVSAWFYVK